ncbi:MAG TPA: helix-turn-helix domain-containing protein [Streptosporangiaceae bacterium]
MPRATQFYTVDELVELLRLDSRKSLYWLNWRGTGPPYYRLGKEIRYAAADVEKWLESRRVEQKAAAP